jgi:hypothetical protein
MPGIVEILEAVSHQHHPPILQFDHDDGIGHGQTQYVACCAGSLDRSQPQSTEACGLPGRIRAPLYEIDAARWAGPSLAKAVASICA